MGQSVCHRLASRDVYLGIAFSIAFFLASSAFLPRGVEAQEGGSPAGTFIRGDADDTGTLELNDAVYTLRFLFLGNTGDPYCLDALDTNDDGKLNVVDAIWTLNFLFLGGPQPLAPFPEAGSDPTPEKPELSCENWAFGTIKQTIFKTTCASLSCHSSIAAKGGLILEGDKAYSQLYLVPPVNEAARAAGLLRVNPGDPEKSFLYLKVACDPAPDGAPPGCQLPVGGGDRMPQLLGRLSDEKVELIRKWIKDGAAPSTFQDITLEHPSRGEQFLVPPFSIAVGQEVQRHYYHKLGNEETLWVNRIEFLYPPGSHHLNLFSTDTPEFSKPEGS